MPLSLSIKSTRVTHNITFMLNVFHKRACIHRTHIVSHITYQTLLTVVYLCVQGDSVLPPNMLENQININCWYNLKFKKQHNKTQANPCNSPYWIPTSYHIAMRPEILCNYNI